MSSQIQTILQSARIFEMQTQANELAALVRPAPVVVSASRRGTDHRRLLLLLARERRRNVRLAAELVK